MKMKFVPFCLSLFLASQTSIAAQQLGSYEAIKSHLLQGSTINVIADLENNCVLQSKDGSLPYSPNIWGMTISTFVIQHQSGDIILPLTIINAPNEKYSAAYDNEEMFISPNNEVKIVSKAVSLLDHKVFSSSVVSCSIANKKTNGIKFLIA